MKETLERLIAERGEPKFVRSDNGPECVCWALTFWLRVSGTESRIIDPGCPWRSGYAESFITTLRADSLDVTRFYNVVDAPMQTSVWRWLCNVGRPPEAPRGLTPAANAAQIRGAGRTTANLQTQSPVSALGA